MIKSYEKSGKTEEEAIAAALRDLGLSRDDVSVEILERAKSGFLGIGAVQAVVRVQYETDEPEAAPAPAAAPAAPKPAAKSGGSKPRPKGTQRLVVDVADEVADAFKERARSMRFAQTDAIAGALQLLAELDDDGYEKLLLSTRR